MDNVLFGLVEALSPKFNQLILDGLAVEHMRHVEAHVDQLFRSAAKGFPEGLKYLDYVACSPYDEYNTIVNRGQKPTYDIAPSDLYLVEYRFSFNGVPMSRHLYLPFVRDAGLITIRGSTYAISPVLADKALSVGSDSIFIPLECAKLTFQRDKQHFYINGERESVDVVFSEVYNLTAKARQIGGRPKVVAQSTMMHYLLCKYGLEATFVRYGNASVHVGYSLDINEDNYPINEWIICSSTHMQPAGVKSKFYVASDIRLAVRIAEYSSTVANMIGGFFYLVDHYPQRVEPEFVNHIRLWRTLMGHVLFGGEGSEGKMVVDINTHMESLDEYMDEKSQERLSSVGLPCEDLYDLFAHMISSFSERVVQAEHSEASMYGKELMVLRYVLADINSAIYRFKFAVRRNSHKPTTENEVKKAMQTFLNPDVITKINRGHGEVSGVSSPGDNKFFKITSTLVPQTSATGKGRGKAKSALTDPSKVLHVSIAANGQYTNLPKSSPDGRTRINPAALTDAEGRALMEDPELSTLLASAQKEFKN